MHIINLLLSFFARVYRYIYWRTFNGYKKVKKIFKETYKKINKLANKINRWFYWRCMNIRKKINKLYNKIVQFTNRSKRWLHWRYINFNKKITNVANVFKTKKIYFEQFKDIMSIRELFTNAKINTYIISLSLFFTFLVGVLNILEFRMTFLFIDALLQKINAGNSPLFTIPFTNLQIPYLLFILASLFYIILLSSFLTYKAITLLQTQLQIAEIQLRNAVFTRMLHFGKQYYDNTSVANTQNYVLELPKNVIDNVQNLYNATNEIMMFFAFTFVLFWLSVKITLIVFGLFIISTVLFGLFSNRFRSLANIEYNTKEELSSRIFNILTGISLIKSTLSEKKEEQSFLETSIKEVNARNKIVRQHTAIEQLHNILSIFVLFIVTFIIIYLSAQQPIANIIIYIMVVRMMSPLIPALGKLQNNLAQGSYLTNELLTLLRSNTDKFLINSGSHTVSTLKGTISFKKLSFHYKANNPVLKDITFSIKAGLKVALVGKSGSGKSTIVQLLMRYYEVEPKRIFIDGKDICDYNTISLLNRIAYINQDIFLFNESILFNLQYGNEHMNEKNIITALKQVNLWSMINSLPHKLNTIVGDRGVQLSGGEKQRIALARAILQNADIWIFDEAFSALDELNSRNIQHVISKITAQKTVIHITHEADHLAEFDQIICLDAGKVAEVGTYQELIAQRGIFAQLFNLTGKDVQNYVPEKKKPTILTNNIVHTASVQRPNFIEEIALHRVALLQHALLRQKSKMQKLENNMSYTIGRKITWLPRAFKQSIYSLRKKFLFPQKVITNTPSLLHTKSKYTPKLDLAHSYRTNLHRSGWGYAVDALKPIHNEFGVFCDDFLEKNFAWQDRLDWQRTLEAYENGDFSKEYMQNDQIVPYRQPWVGFFHNPPNIPKWMNVDQSPQIILQKKIWKESIPYCKGIFCLSDYHKNWLESKLKVPIVSLVHPTEIPDILFDAKRFLENKEKKIIQTGWWLRRMHSIYELPTKNYEKVFLHLNQPYVYEAFEREREYLQYEGDYSSARIQTFVPNEAYDALMSENVILLDLYDSSANNAVIECIARGTPLLINPLPSVQEYLGTEYPLYFSSLEEAAKKAEDLDLVIKAHKYLLQCETRTKLTAEYFCASLANSSIYKNL